MDKEVLDKAIEFAKRKHKGQIYNGSDYFNTHCWTVSHLVHLVGGSQDMQIAALLHDTLEDTDTTYEELVENFGKTVADLVVEVTHEGSKDEDGYYFPNLKTQDGILIKFADRLCNISNMDDWSEKRKGQYLRKSRFWNTSGGYEA